MTQNASRLYNELIKFGSQYSAWSDVRHLEVMVRMIATGSVNLTKWLTENIIKNCSVLSSILLLSTGLPRLLSVNKAVDRLIPDFALRVAQSNTLNAKSIVQVKRDFFN